MDNIFLTSQVHNLDKRVILLEAALETVRKYMIREANSRDLVREIDGLIGREARQMRELKASK